ncbi:MAG: HincII family type II restriction endonuclease [Cellulomonadaceae bacterium]|jgi:type II restriction enzyme|nr:HincII family type II restriction endonuclease [Cellulomonadaceae bacterium]
MARLELIRIAAESLIDTRVPRPNGQLAGHAGGLAFEGPLQKKLEAAFPGRAFRHYEALNHAMRNHWPGGVPSDDLESVHFGPPDVDFLVRRGANDIKKWSQQTTFQERQQDTAETIVFPDTINDFSGGLISLVDAKSQNDTKKSQPPNIISAVKMAKVAEIVLSKNLIPNFELIYVEIGFDPTPTELICTQVRTIDMFKIPLDNIYINWAAATQIQFHPFTVDQSYSHTPRQWLIGFLRAYFLQLGRRLSKQQKEIKSLENLIIKSRLENI